MTRKKISAETKEQAIRLVVEHGVKVPKVAAELGIGRSTIEKYLKEYRDKDSDGVTVDEKAELKRLREENRILKLEKELLKKATVYFAKQSE